MRTQWNTVWIRRPRMIDDRMWYPWQSRTFAYMNNRKGTVTLSTGTSIPKTWIRTERGFMQGGFWRRKF